MEIVTKFIKDVYNTGEYEKELQDNNVEYKKIENVRVYDHGIWGGTTYDILEYRKKNGQRALLCVTGIAYMDDLVEEGIMIFLDDDEEYTVEEVAKLIRDYNEAIDKSDPLEIVYTFAEAGALWDISTSNLRNNVRNDRFKKGEVRKSGDIWLVTKKAMERLYGSLED